MLHHTIAELLPKNAIMVGFIESSFPNPSLIASTKAGCLIGKNVRFSPDGKHPSFLEIYWKGKCYVFDGKIISVDSRKEPLKSVFAKIRNCLKSNRHLVGYNSRKKRLEELKPANG